jgi:excisionase family DNA binding protein
MVKFTTVDFETLTLHQVSMLLQVSAGTIYRYKQHEHFPKPISEPGKKVLFNREEVKEWTKKYKRATT